MARIRDLFIPRKTNGNAPQPDYGTDMRAIESWAKEVNNQLAAGGGIQQLTSTDGTVTITNPTGPTTDLHVSLTSGGYASLTGAGQATTPGELYQEGQFNIGALPNPNAGAPAFTVTDTSGSFYGVAIWNNVSHNPYISTCAGTNSDGLFPTAKDLTIAVGPNSNLNLQAGVNGANRASIVIQDNSGTVSLGGVNSSVITSGTCQLSLSASGANPATTVVQSSNNNWIRLVDSPGTVSQDEFTIAFFGAGSAPAGSGPQIQFCFVSSIPTFTTKLPTFAFGSGGHIYFCPQSTNAWVTLI